MEQITVKILDRDYKLAVSAEDKERLAGAAQLVDSRMRTIRDSGKVSGQDRIAVMVALQLAHELSDPSNASATLRSAKSADKLRKISEDVDQAIRKQESLF
jgi:cell division protein ZapA